MEKKSKKDIRTEVKKRRREAEAEMIHQNSEKICDAFLTLPEYRKAETVFAYMDCKNEVETAKVIEQCGRTGKRLLFRKCSGKS